MDVAQNAFLKGHRELFSQYQRKSTWGHCGNKTILPESSKDLDNWLAVGENAVDSNDP